ncbi:MAG: PQQ-dependent sugar dehydrogenase, partial [Candidatus Latescibacterota bacterium]
MKRNVFILLMTGLSILVIIAAVFSFKNFRGIGPVVKPPPEDIADRIPAVPDTASAAPGRNETDLPLRLPPGFSISIFARDVPGARVMVQDSFGNFWVSRTRQGTVSVLEVREGRVARRSDVFRGRNNPHGLAMGPHDLLYIAEEDKVSRVTLYSDDTLHKIADLPSGGGHSTRTIMFGPDGRLYVSIGSSCNVCEERDARRAAIYVMNPDGSNFRQYASGLRNAVFMTTNPVDGDIWATEMGRDLLGDDLPPDEVNIIREGKHYGWPWCYGNRVHDEAFDSRGERSDFCRGTEPPVIEIPAHSAPLGLAFVPEEGWPEEYWYNLMVAYHGSWNRSQPTGYKIVRHILDARGNYRGSEDFITGWLRGGSALGRPVDIMVQPGGIMYISDDKAGVIYRVAYRG